MQIVVPTHARADVVGTKTLRLLAERGVPRDVVHLVIDPAELDDYRTVDPGLYADVVKGAPGASAQRNRAIAEFDEGEWVVSIDDDIRDVLRRVDEKHTEPVDDLFALFTGAFDACEQAGATLWGVYPILNPMFMKPGRSTDLKFCIGHLHGVVNTREPWAQWRLSPKGDYAQTLARYEHDGTVVRLNDIATKTSMYAGGGGSAVNAASRESRNRSAVLALLDEYPYWVKVQKRRSKQGLEILLRDRGTPPR